METRANYAIIGLFTLAVIAGGFGFVYWFSGRERGGQRMSYQIVFDSSVSGLSRGSQVLFNGIRKGEVTEITLDPQDPRKVIAIIAVDPGTPIRADTAARLEYQGLTGVASVQLSGGKADAGALQPQANGMGRIDAQNSDFQDLIATARRIAERADQVLVRVDQLISQNQAPITQTIANVKQFTDALAANSEGVNRFLSSTSNAADRIAALSVKLEQLSESVDTIVKAIDPPTVTQIVGDVKTFTGTLAANKDQIDQVLKDVASLAAQLNQTAPKLDAAIADIGNVAKAFDPAKIGRTVENIDRFTATLGANDANIDKVLKDFAQISGRLDSIVATIDLNTPQIDAVLKDAASIARQLNLTAPKLDAAVADIGNLARAFDPAKITRTVENIDRFTATLGANDANIDKALKDIAAITGKLDSVVATFDANRPQIDALIKDAATVASQLTTTAPKLDAAIADFGNLAKAFDPAKISRTVENIDRFTATLGANDANIDKVLKDFAQISGRLDSIVATIDVNTPQIDALLKDAAAIARQLNLSAPKLDAAIADIGNLAKAFDPAKITRTVDNIDRFTATLGANDANIDKALKDIAAITGKLDSVVATFDANRPQIDALLNDAASLARQLNQTAPKLDAAIADISNVAKAFDPAKIGRTIDSIERVAGTLGANDANIDKVLKDAAAITGKLDQVVTTFDLSRPQIEALLKDAASLARQLNQTAPKLDTALADIGNVAKALDPARIGRTVENIDRVAAVFGDNNGNIDKALKEIASITGKLDVAAGRLDGVLAAAQKFFGDEGGEGKGAFAEIAETARSIRVVAQNLDKRAAEITASITQFTGPGLREYQALATDGRKAIGDIQRVLRSLERNPQQLIFGGRPAIPEFRGR